LDSAGLGSERPDGVSRDDDEFDAYRKRMMLAYRFRPNPLVRERERERERERQRQRQRVEEFILKSLFFRFQNNPRRPYY